MKTWRRHAALTLSLLLCGLGGACAGDDTASATDASATDATTDVASTSAGTTTGENTSGAGTTAGTGSSSDGETSTSSGSTAGDATSSGGDTRGTTDADTTGTSGDTTGDPGEEITVNFFYGYFMYDNYLAEVEGHSNVVLGPSTIDFLLEAKSRGMKPIVWLATTVSLWDLAGDHLVLKPDYLDIWNSYAAQIAPHVDDIYAFYPVDEPFWASGLSADDQNKLNQAIKASFPDVPIMTTFARPTIDDANFVVPSSYDIVGYDNYYGASFDSDYQYYQVLKSKIAPGQKMFLIGDGFEPHLPLTEASQTHKGTKIYQAYQLARTPGEPLVGILNFVWNGYHKDWPKNTGDYYPGIRDMPLASPHFIQVGETALAEQ